MTNVSTFINDELIKENERLRELVRMQQQALEADNVSVELSRKITEVLNSLNTRLINMESRLNAIESRLNTLSTMSGPIYYPSTGTTTLGNYR